MQLIYVMDPMCAWCYGFQPELDAFIARHTIDVKWVMGGLAPDSEQPMADALKTTIADYWHQIEARTQVSFNHDYWHTNTPYRSTYQACRAVIAADNLVEGGAAKMVKAIQAAYYQMAQNPSKDAILIACASAIGLDEMAFSNQLKAASTQERLEQELSLTQRLKVSGFPALFYVDNSDNVYPLAHGFCQAQDLDHRLNLIKQRLRN